MKVHEASEMDVPHWATEQAYKNGYKQGYEDGKRDAVKHGRWVYEPVEFTYEKDIKCSVCSAYVDHVTRYCPNCGAKMDGKDNVPRMDGERKDNEKKAD